MQAPLVDPLSILDVEDLKEIVARHRADLVEAEDGQLWVDAIAAEVAGVASEARAALNRALAALDGDVTDEARAALDRMSGDVIIRNRAAARSVAAAQAHRVVTVDRARARLDFYEAMLATAPATGPVPGARAAIAEFEAALAG